MGRTAYPWGIQVRVLATVLGMKVAGPDQLMDLLLTGFVEVTGCTLQESQSSACRFQPAWGLCMWAACGHRSPQMEVGGVLVLQNGSGCVSDDLYPCGRSEGSCDPTALSLLSLLFGTGERLGDESLPPTDKVRL